MLNMCIVSSFERGERVDIGGNIRRVRLERRMTQEQLAKGVGVTTSMITQIERGTKHATMELGKEIADVLGCNIAVLYGEENKED